MVVSKNALQARYEKVFKGYLNLPVSNDLLSSMPWYGWENKIA
jgi:hypothetical protein